MRILLSNRELRHLSLVEALLEKGVMTFKEVSKLIHYPVRTLSSDVDQINETISPSEIITSKTGLSLHIPRNSSVRQIYFQFMKNNRESQLLQELLFSQPQTLEDIADILYISVPTLNRLIRDINERIAFLDIRITASPFRISGNEVRVTLFFTMLLDEMYLMETEDRMMTEQQERILKELLDNVNLYFKKTVPFSEYRMILTRAFVRATRLKFGHHIVEDRKKFSSVLLESDKFRQEFEEAFDIELNVETVYELFSFYFRNSYIHSIGEMNILKNEDPRIYDLSNSVDLFLKKVSDETGLKLNDNGALILKFYNFLDSFGFKTRPLYDKNSQFVANFKMQHSVLYTIITEAIYESFGYDIEKTGVDTLLRLLINNWPELMKKTDLEAPSLNIGIYFDANQEQAEIAAHLVKRYARMNTEITIIPPQQALDSVMVLDILITNIPGLSSVQTEIICVQEYPSLKDWDALTILEEQVFNRKVNNAVNA